MMEELRIKEKRCIAVGVSGKRPRYAVDLTVFTQDLGLDLVMVCDRVSPSLLVVVP